MRAYQHGRTLLGDVFEAVGLNTPVIVAEKFENRPAEGLDVSAIHAELVESHRRLGCQLSPARQAAGAGDFTSRLPWIEPKALFDFLGGNGPWIAHPFSAPRPVCQTLPASG